MRSEIATDDTRVFFVFVSNNRLKLAKNSAKAKQHVEAELFTKMSQKTSAPVLMRLSD